MYRTLREHGTQWDSKQCGLFRSIEDESLLPDAHLQQGLQLRLWNTPAATPVPHFVQQATEEYTRCSLASLRAHRQGAIAF